MLYKSTFYTNAFIEWEQYLRKGNMSDEQTTEELVRIVKIT